MSRANSVDGCCRTTNTCYSRTISCGCSLVEGSSYHAFDQYQVSANTIATSVLACVLYILKNAKILTGIAVIRCFPSWGAPPVGEILAKTCHPLYLAVIYTHYYWTFLTTIYPIIQRYVIRRHFDRYLVWVRVRDGVRVRVSWHG